MSHRAKKKGEIQSGRSLEGPTWVARSQQIRTRSEGPRRELRIGEKGKETVMRTFGLAEH